MPLGNGRPRCKTEDRRWRRHPGGGAEDLQRLGSGIDVLSVNHALSIGGGGATDKQPVKRQHRWVISLTQHRTGVPIRRGLTKLLAETKRLVQDDNQLPAKERKLLLAGLFDFQIRLLLEAELDLASMVYWDLLFWQDQLKHPHKAWVESGPFTWFQPDDQSTTIEDKLDSLQKYLVEFNIATGILQQHLTRKIVNTDYSYLPYWCAEAAELIDEVLQDRITLDKVLDKSWVVPTRTTDPSLKEALAHAEHLPELIAERKAKFLQKMEPLRAPSLLRRRWLYLLVASPFVLWTIRFVYMSRADLPKWLARAMTSSRNFYYEHVHEPARAIVKEVLFNEKDKITDMAALADAKESLKRMLEDFLRDSRSDLSEQQKRQAADKMDMSTVSEQYERSLPRAIVGIMTGDILRMLLIQVQFLKKELLVAMSAIDELMDSNQFNFRLMAIFPAVIVLYTGYLGLKSVSYAVRRKKNASDTAALLRSFLLSMERMLNLRNVGASEEDVKYHKLDRSGTFVTGMNNSHYPPDMSEHPHEDYDPVVGVLRPPRLSAGGESSAGGATVLNPVVFLKSQDLGLLLLYIHQLATVIARNPRLFNELELRNFQEDLQELAGDSGLVTVTQQVATVQRMFRSYRFLNNSSSYALFSL